jgi:hypothetical protein
MHSIGSSRMSAVLAQAPQAPVASGASVVALKGDVQALVQTARTALTQRNDGALSAMQTAFDTAGRNSAIQDMREMLQLQPR